MTLAPRGSLTSRQRWVSPRRPRRPGGLGADPARHAGQGADVLARVGKQGARGHPTVRVAVAVPASVSAPDADPVRPGPQPVAPG